MIDRNSEQRIVPEDLIAEFIAAKGNKKKRVRVYKLIKGNSYLFTDEMLRRLIKDDTKDGFPGNYANWFQNILSGRLAEKRVDVALAVEAA
jgi:hypothetical protein